MIVCSPELGLSPESNSGGEVYDREVLHGLCARGVKVLTLMPKDHHYTPHKHLSVEFTGIKSIVPPHLFSALVLPYLIKTYQKYHFDILRVHNPYFIGPAAHFFHKLYPKVPIVGSALHVESGLNLAIEKKVSKIFSKIITISKSTKKELIEKINYPSEKIEIAYPGVDKRFKPGEKSSKKITLMFVGGLKPRKNPLFLLKVWQKLNLSNAELVFAGDGPLRSRLEGKNVKVTGFIPEADKPTVYNAADIVLLPSVKEGFGMTLLEAGVSGLPVVANNAWSIPEIVKDGVTGFLAEPNNINDWASKLIQLIKSDSLRHKFGLAARKLVTKKFTWEKNINIHLKVYESLVR